MFADDGEDAQCAVMVSSDGKYTDAYRTTMKVTVLKDKEVQVFMAPIAKSTADSLKVLWGWAPTGSATAAAGSGYTALRGGDGGAMARGLNIEGQCDLPALVADLGYPQDAAEGHRAVLLEGEGSAVACSRNEHGQGDLPALVADLSYAQATAGAGTQP